VPALCALSGCSIFMASSTTISRPASTVSPSATATLTMVPCIGAVSASPEAARRPSCRRRRAWGGLLARPPPPPPPRAEAGRQRDLEPLAADLDDDRLARAGLLGSASAAPANGGMVLSNSVSIQRVKTVNGSSAGVNAGSRTTARWNGSAVAMPSTTNSSSARRARSSASVAVAPVTISLASSESNCAADHRAGLDAGVHPDAGAGRLAEPW
jgi:hypothetical protein